MMTNRLRRIDDEHTANRTEDWTMPVTAKRTVALYVDRATREWVVRDPEGAFWRLPPVDDSWQQRQPFDLTDESELDIVPGHYQYMLNLPF